jgi:hypothetical protein
VLLPVIIGIGIASYYLFQDYHPVADEDAAEISREVVGEILFVENNVKRQLGNDVMWDSIAVKMPVYSNDSIRTGKDSTTAIKLTDNTVIEVGENSLIVLDKSQQTLGVNFKAGDILAKNTSQGIEIKVKDSVVKGAGAELKIKTGPDAQASIEVAKGKAVVTDKNKKRTEINQAEQAGFSDNGLEQVSKIAVVLRTPEHRSQIQSNRDDVKHPFTWEVLRADLKEEQLEISKTKFFKPENTKTYKAHQAINANLTQGLQFWRVGWMDKGHMLYTEPRQITVGQDKRIELIYPENETRFDFEPEENQIEMQWKSQIPVKVHVLEVSSSNDFKNIAFTRTLSDVKALVKDLGPHVYYWRVRAYGDKNDELAISPVSSFTLKVRLPKLPELAKPIHEFDWETPEPVDFGWKKMEKALEYRITISRDEDQKEVVKTKIVPATNFLWPWSTAGHYYWSVKAIGQKSTTIGASEIRRINIKPKAKSSAYLLIYPKQKGEVIRDQTDNPEPILFQWQTTRSLPGPSTIILAKNPEFKDAVKQDGITKLSVPVRLKTLGTYYWKLMSPSPEKNAPADKNVSAGAEADKNVDRKTEETSEVGTFTLKLSSSSLAPVLIDPANKAKIEFEAKDVAVKFTWKPMVPSAQYHIVTERVDVKTGQRVTVVDRVVKTLEFTSAPLTEGTYVWSVSGMDEQGLETSTSRAGEFYVVPEELMEAPKLNAPVVK